jgi:hypothetical protein
MPEIAIPDIATRIAFRPGVSLYAKDFREEMPLYRNVKLITAEPFFKARRSAHLTWIVHMGRCRGGGDCWILEQHNPELRKWIEQQCAEVFDAQYVMDTLGIEQAEYDALVAAEQAKYKK